MKQVIQPNDADKWMINLTQDQKVQWAKIAERESKKAQAEGLILRVAQERGCKIASREMMKRIKK